jgi:hypothetical protein
LDQLDAGGHGGEGLDGVGWESVGKYSELWVVGVKGIEFCKPRQVKIMKFWGGLGIAGPSTYLKSHMFFSDLSILSTKSFLGKFVDFSRSDITLVAYEKMAFFNGLFTIGGADSYDGKPKARLVQRFSGEIKLFKPAETFRYYYGINLGKAKKRPIYYFPFQTYCYNSLALYNMNSRKKILN